MKQLLFIKNFLLLIIIGIIFNTGMVPLVLADVYINVMAVNGSPTAKDTTVKFNLPSDVTAQDVLDADGLQLDYNVEDANFYVHGQVKLEPKQSKTFKIRIKDIWKVDQDQVTKIKKEIDEGYQKLGIPHDQKNADQLKDYLDKKLDYIYDAQTNKAESVEKRIDSYRAYDKELRRLKANALAVDYWRSDLNDVIQPKLIRLNIEVENPKTSASKSVKHRHFLPLEVKPEHVIEAEGFDIRFDQQRQQPFLFKEEEITPGEKRKYVVGIMDVWKVPQKEIEYYKSRAKYAFDTLADTRFAESATILNERIMGSLGSVEESQSQQRSIDEHISAYRDNEKLSTQAQGDLATLEKLLALFREDLDKSKVKNILQKVQGLKGVADVSKTMFNKKFESTTAFSFIGWILLFVGVLTGILLIVWLLRSKDKVIINNPTATENKEKVEEKQKS